MAEYLMQAAVTLAIPGFLLLAEWLLAAIQKRERNHAA